MYTFDSRIRYSEIGEDGNLTLPGLINYFQDCSTFQSEDLGIGTTVLKEEKRACSKNEAVPGCCPRGRFMCAAIHPSVKR